MWRVYYENVIETEPGSHERITTPALAQAFITEQVAAIREQVGDKKVLLALSGGVDSSVVAALLIKAIGKNLTCVHVNHGLLRKGEPEQVIDVFGKQLNANLVYVDAIDRLIWQIIANKRLIDLNQDALGVQAKRIYSSIPGKYAPDREYLTNIDRVDILAKPLSDGSVALSFINVSETEKNGDYSVDVSAILNGIGAKLPSGNKWTADTKSFTVTDLWTGEVSENTTGVFGVKTLAACGNVTIKVTPNA